MLIVLSPAKSLDYETPVSSEVSTSPQFMKDAAELIEVATGLTPEGISELMNISSALANLNAERFSNWSLTPDLSTTRQAVFAFNGDVYDGVDARNMNVDELIYLQSHLRILSGLYGLLRPMDLIQAYRLEMGSRLTNLRGDNLYSFWGDSITNAINVKVKKDHYGVLVNLASEEYFKSVKKTLLDVPVITPIFQDFKNGKFKIISFYAKRARGLMVRYCAENKIKNADDLKLFDYDGYAFSEEQSTPDRWMFRRTLNE
jgi:cytoplasmic iron level regulating protein YaaA (DUF328/UPF0246 family)